jgi:hypothetical protein
MRDPAGSICEAAIMAILSGTERIDEALLDAVELDRAATGDAAAVLVSIRHKTTRIARDYDPKLGGHGRT